MTDRYVVIGNPVAHSRSPFIHAAFARQTAQDDELRPPARARSTASNRPCAPSPLKAARGCNVTMPFKFDAFALVDEHTPRGALAGACNTLRFDAGRLARRQHRRRRAAARHRAQRRRRPGRPARAPDRRRRRRGRRARTAARGAAGTSSSSPTGPASVPCACCASIAPRPRRRAPAASICGPRRSPIAAEGLRRRRQCHGKQRARRRDAGRRPRRCDPARFAIDMMYGVPARGLHRLGHGTWRDRARRPRHAGRAGGGGLRAVRAASGRTPRRCWQRCASAWKTATREGVRRVDGPAGRARARFGPGAAAVLPAPRRADGGRRPAVDDLPALRDLAARDSRSGAWHGASNGSTTRASRRT